MSKFLKNSVIFSACLITLLGIFSASEKFVGISKATYKPSENRVSDTVPNGSIRIKQAYPAFIQGVEKNEIVWKDGSKMIYDEGINANKNFQEILKNADLKSQMEISYPKGQHYEIPKKNEDPGRIRNEEFFKKMYGKSREEVLKKLVTITWLPKSANIKLQITSINEIDKKLMAVSNELDNIPELKKYVDKPAGTFNWRKIAGEDRLSMHSFGIAIDINTSKSDYWKWSLGAGSGEITYVNRIPLKIVEIFEKYGFIWGGKWYHFDTMHFEYRPDLLNN